MNFEEWKRENIMPGTCSISLAEKSWDACKQEVLKVLDNNQYDRYDEEGNCRISRQVIVEIEKL